MTNPVQAKQVTGTGKHVVFSGTLTIPATALGGSSNAVVAVNPAVQGDSLATSDNITIHFRAALPTGLNIANYVVTAANQVTVYFTSNVAISAGSTIAMTVVAHR